MTKHACTRPCRACGGTGCAEFLSFSRPCCLACDGTGCPICLACDGTGRIEDTGYMPASDAQADARTLIESLDGERALGLRRLRTALQDARNWGACMSWSDHAATMAARAAFRAVPGLRA
jgi:hypothetical protein